jgi:hypothetical protein
MERWENGHSVCYNRTLWIWLLIFKFDRKKVRIKVRGNVQVALEKGAGTNEYFGDSSVQFHIF